MDYTKQMVKGVSTGSNYDTVITTITGLCLVADEAASTDVGFTGTWTGKICYTGDGAARTITLTLGYVTGSTFTAAFGATQSFSTVDDVDDHSVDISITPSGTFTIPSGSYLALKITISSSSQSLWAEGSDTTGTAPKRAESCCGSSRLISPSSDPGYPVPELSTLILMSSGLVTGTAVLIYGNKKKR